MARCGTGWPQFGCDNHVINAEIESRSNSIFCTLCILLGESQLTLNSLPKPASECCGRTSGLQALLHVHQLLLLSGENAVEDGLHRNPLCRSQRRLPEQLVSKPLSKQFQKGRLSSSDHGMAFNQCQNCLPSFALSSANTDGYGSITLVA